MSIFSNLKKYQKLYTDVKSLMCTRGFIANFQISAAKATAASANGIHLANATSAALTTITTAITSPLTPRNITATAAGTAADIKAVQVIITGTNFNDEIITETLPAFTVDTAGIVSGAKAFKTVTKIEIPAMDGAGATVAIGQGSILGLPYILDHKAILKAYLDNVIDTVAAETFGATLSLNTFTLTTALSGKVVDVYLIV